MRLRMKLKDRVLGVTPMTKEDRTFMYGIFVIACLAIATILLGIYNIKSNQDYRMVQQGYEQYHGDWIKSK